MVTLWYSLCEILVAALHCCLCEAPDLRHGRRQAFGMCAQVASEFHDALVTLHPTSPQAPACWCCAKVLRACRHAVPCFLQAIPEDIPLDVVFEDDHLIVINKVRLPVLASRV